MRRRHKNVVATQYSVVYTGSSPRPQKQVAERRSRGQPLPGAFSETFNWRLISW